MNPSKRAPSWGTALVAIVLVVLSASACSRKKPPTTEIRTTNTGADTSSVRPTEPERATTTEADRLAAARTTIGEKIFFEFNKSDIQPEARDVLSRKADVMNQFPEISIRIEGNCDERGTVEYNLALGERRAQAAKDYLVNAGVDPDRVATISYGEERPAVQGHDEEAWSQNRRDEFMITSAPGAGT